MVLWCTHSALFVWYFAITLARLCARIISTKSFIFSIFIEPALNWFFCFRGIFGHRVQGVHGRHADIDTLCMGPSFVTPEHFFTDLYQRLKVWIAHTSLSQTNNHKSTHISNKSTEWKLFFANRSSCLWQDSELTTSITTVQTAAVPLIQMVFHGSSKQSDLNQMWSRPKLLSLLIFLCLLLFRYRDRFVVCTHNAADYSCGFRHYGW